MLNLYPIGNFSFRFDKRKYKKNTCIWVGDITIKHETKLEISEEQYNNLLSFMKERNSDLLTDGKKFYTTKDLNHTVEIDHDLFKEMLKESKVS